MSHVDGTLVSVWTLSTTQDSTVLALADAGGLTPERL